MQCLKQAACPNGKINADGWTDEAKSAIPPERVCLWRFSSSILICRRSPFVRGHCNLPAADYGHSFPGADASEQRDKRGIGADLLFVQLLRSPHSGVYPGPRAESKVAAPKTATPPSPFPSFHNMPSDTNNPQKKLKKHPHGCFAQRNTIHNMIQSGSFI